MYLQHFGLAQYPFSLTPNTRYFLKLPSHQLAFDSIVKALRGEGCFSLITGEVGTGKTMLCRKVLNALGLHPKKFTTAYIPHPILNEEAIMQHIADELKIESSEPRSYRTLLKQISAEILHHAEEKRQVILFIDEAQAIPEDSLRAIHLLTQVPNESHSSFQVILFGQPELESLLDRPSLRQVKEDIGFSFELPALDREGLEAYVEYRLTKAGYSGEQLFAAGAMENLLQHSGGVPRMINILCHKAMMAAFGKGDRQVKEAHVQAAVDDTLPKAQQSSWISSLLPGKRDS